MPLYEYRCDACGHRFEKIQKFSDPHIDVCPNCGARQVQKLLSSPAIQFKGSGWYITDYARKGTDGKEGAAKADGKEAKPASPESKASGTESKSADSSSSSSDSSGTTSTTPSSSKS
jgi:putative FmdB family regulatory protein